MQLSKRAGSPFFWVSFTDDNGKRHRVSTKCTDKREAAKAAGLIVNRAAEAAPLGNSITLWQALDAYRAKLELAGQPSYKNIAVNRDKTTGALVSGAGRWHLKGSMWLHELTSEHLQDLVKARMTEGNSSTTIAHELKTLRASVAYAKRGKKRVPEIDNWDIPKLVQKTRYLSDAEWQMLYDRLSPDRELVQATTNRGTFKVSTSARSRAMMQDAQDLLVCLTYCGGRWSEVASLTFDRVNLEAGTITLWGNKTQKERLAPLPALLKAVVVRRLQTRVEGQKLLFPGSAGTIRTHSSRAIVRAIKACGLNDDPQVVKQNGRCTVHSLRHTFASWLLQRGASLPDIKDAIGHSTLAMTMRYAHLSTVDTTAKLTGLLS